MLYPDRSFLDSSNSPTPVHTTAPYAIPRISLFALRARYDEPLTTRADYPLRLECRQRVSGPPCVFSHGLFRADLGRRAWTEHPQHCTRSNLHPLTLVQNSHQPPWVGLTSTASAYSTPKCSEITHLTGQRQPQSARSHLPSSHSHHPIPQRIFSFTALLWLRNRWRHASSSHSGHPSQHLRSECPSPPSA